MELSQQDQSFDRIAFLYDGLVKLVFGSVLRKAQCHFLEELPHHGRVLIMGGGSGWILEEIANSRKRLSIDYVEASEAMIKLAKERELELEVNFIHGNEEYPTTGQEYDVVVTPFFLDLFGPKRFLRSMEKLDLCLAKQGMWIFTDFYIPTKGFARYYAKALIFVMYRFFRMCCGIDARKLPGFDQAFQQMNYEMKAEALYYFGIVRSRMYQKKSTA